MQMEEDGSIVKGNYRDNWERSWYLSSVSRDGPQLFTN